MEENEQQEIIDLYGDIYNLSGALNNLLDVDSRTLGKERKKKLLAMRQIVFDTLSLHIDMIVNDGTIDEGEEIPDKQEYEDD